MPTVAEVEFINILVHLYIHRVKSSRLWPEKPFDIPLFEKYVCFACVRWGVRLHKNGSGQSPK